MRIAETRINTGFVRHREKSQNELGVIRDVEAAGSNPVTSTRDGSPNPSFHAGLGISFA